MKEKTIHDLVQQAQESVVAAGYSKGTIWAVRGTWTTLEQYAEEKGIIGFSHEFGIEFLRERYGITSLRALDRKSQMRARAVDMLSEVQNHGYIPARRTLTGYVFPDTFKAVIEGYIRQRESDGITPTGVQITKLYLERFSGYLSAQGIDSLDSVELPVIEGFIKSLSAYGRPTINHTMRSVRGLLQYAYDTGVVTVDRSGIVPRILYNKRARIPSAYTSDEISRVIDVVDQGNPIGKRDYAIMLLASRLGLRASDVCRLSFENIKWEDSRIEIIQHKTECVLILPLTEEVGMAIINYLQNGRPVTDSPNVFVKHVPPYNEMTTSNLYTIVSRYFEKSGVLMPPGKKRGPHALRHSLASALLENGTPLPLISEILGHADSKTTGVYLKIDIKNLLKCALPVPLYATTGEAGSRYDEE